MDAGDDPNTPGGVNEQQKIECDATGGLVAFSYRGYKTNFVSVSASPATLQQELEAIIPLRAVDVTLNAGAAICDASTSEVLVEFLTETGDIPLLVPDVSRLTGGTATVTEVQAGDKEFLECNNRGVCGKYSMAAS